MRAFVRDNSLSLFFAAILLAALAGQSVAGWQAFNAEQVEHQASTISYARYLVSSHFGQAVLENWQSEWLQFVLFVLAATFLYQRGSADSPPEPGLEGPKAQRLGRYADPDSPLWAKVGGWRTALYSWSLPILMAVLFLGSWVGQSLTGRNQYNDDQLLHDGQPLSWLHYVATPEFWEDTLQNWQSEFLAVGAMAVFTIFLRSRGSAESKPVGEPHDSTGS